MASRRRRYRGRRPSMRPRQQQYDPAFCGIMPQACMGGCWSEDPAVPCPPGHWDLDAGQLGHVCCPGTLKVCDDEYPPAGTYEAMSVSQLVGTDPQGNPINLPSWKRLCAGLPWRNGKYHCPSTHFLTDQDRCWPRGRGLEECFYHDAPGVPPMAQCPPGFVTRAVVPESPNPTTRVCCPLDPGLGLGSNVLPSRPSSPEGLAHGQRPPGPPPTPLPPGQPAPMIPGEIRMRSIRR